MSELRSDASVFCGATGDLAYKETFPSLQTMLKRGQLALQQGSGFRVENVMATVSCLPRRKAA
jgi:glucose-6-phosphate 1-dehydrogenase